MIKLTLCLICGVVLALYMLNLRDQQLELRHQNAELHDQIKSQQARLWNQQLQIAQFTAPNAISETVKGQDLEMVPQFSTAHAASVQSRTESEKPSSRH